LVQREELLAAEGLLANGHALLARDLEHQLARDAGQDEWRKWMRTQLTILDAQNTRVRALGDDAVPDEDRLERAGDLGLLLRHDVREQLDGLYVAVQPARVRLRDRFGAGGSRCVRHLEPRDHR